MKIRLRSLPFVYIVLILAATSCGGANVDPTEDEEDSFSTSQATCDAHSTSESCDSIPGCSWHGVLELTRDNDGTCHHDRQTMCINSTQASPGEYLTVWRTLDGGGKQVLQFGSIPRFMDDTWVRCDQSDGDPPPACVCEDPDLL